MSEGEVCPSCGNAEWEIDYVRTADGEMRVEHCSRCEWPPVSPMSPKEWREHPYNPLNESHTGSRPE